MIDLDHYIWRLPSSPSSALAEVASSEEDGETVKDVGEDNSGWSSAKKRRRRNGADEAWRLSDITGMMTGGDGAHPQQN